MARKLTTEEAELLGVMQEMIRKHRRHNELRTRFLEGKEHVNAMSVSIPPRLKSDQTPIGWPKKTVEKFSERFRLEGFMSRKGGSDSVIEVLTDHFISPAGKVQFRMAVEGALTHGPAFVFTSRGRTDLGEPEFISTTRSALTATALFDGRSGRVSAALESLPDDKWNLWLPGRVLLIGNSTNPLEQWGVLDTFETGVPRVLCSVYRHDPTPANPYGQSRITRPLMGYTMSAVRTMLRQESAEDVSAAPRMALLGAVEEIFEDEDGNPIEKWDAMTGAIWGVPDITDPDDPLAEPRRPELKSFPQMTQQPYNDKLRMLVEFVAGETSIPASELGLSNDSNPASAEAVQAHEGAMIRAANKQREFLAEGVMSHALDVLSLAFPDDDLASISAGILPRFADPRTISPMEQSQYVASQVAAGNFLPGTAETLRELPLSEEDVQLHVQANTKARNSDAINSRINGADDPRIAEAELEGLAMENFGKAIRAGVTFESAAKRYGLDWAEDSGRIPTTVRVPAEEKEAFEE